MGLQKKLGLKLVDHFNADNDLSDDPELNEWYKSSEENKILYENYRLIWQGSTELAYARKFNTIIGWTKVNNKISIINRTKRRIHNFAYVATGIAASLLITLGLVFYTNTFSFKEEIVLLSTNLGSRSSAVLPDGTSVTLNAGTNLEYRFDNFSKMREVKFNGEGFFQVAKSKNPFIIQTQNGLKLKVLGTKFNLKAYSEDNSIKTTLVEGKVELSSPDNKTLTLIPGQIASYNNRTRELNYTIGQAYQNVGWLNNKLYLDKTSLQEVCTILERSYNVKIVIKDKELGDKIHYTGVLGEETIGDVLDALCKLSEIKYQIKGKNVTINNK
jgi:transmembrane sensor